MVMLGFLLVSKDASLNLHSSFLVVTFIVFRQKIARYLLSMLFTEC